MGHFRLIFVGFTLRASLVNKRRAFQVSLIRQKLFELKQLHGLKGGLHNTFEADILGYKFRFKEISMSRKRKICMRLE